MQHQPLPGPLLLRGRGWTPRQLRGSPEQEDTVAAPRLFRSKKAGALHWGKGIRMAPPGSKPEPRMCRLPPAPLLAQPEASGVPRVSRGLCCVCRAWPSSERGGSCRTPSHPAALSAHTCLVPRAMCSAERRATASPHQHHHPAGSRGCSRPWTHAPSLTPRALTDLGFEPRILTPPLSRPAGLVSPQRGFLIELRACLPAQGAGQTPRFGWDGGARNGGVVGSNPNGVGNSCCYFSALTAGFPGARTARGG